MMPDDPRRLLAPAAPDPSEVPDFDALWRKARRQRLAARLLGATTVAAVVAVGVLILPGALDSGQPTLIGDPTVAASSSYPVTTAQPPQTVNIPTQPHPVGPDHPGPTARLDGRIAGDADTECLWIEPVGDSRASSDRISVVWPHGYSARFGQTIQLIDEDGDVVAEEGDVVRTAGGHYEGVTLDSCHVSDSVWSTHTIEILEDSDAEPSPPTPTLGG